MTSGVMQADQLAIDTNLTAPSAEVPQFDHAIRSWVLVATGALMVLLLVALFVYGEIAPGA